MSYLRQYGTRVTPQSEPIPGTTQVPNSAGGHAWAVDDWTRLRRFLILGSEGGSYYASERALTKANAGVVVRCAKADGARTVQEIVNVSVGGRAPKNDPAIFALAVCASLGDAATRRLALAQIPAVCRIGTHLFHFAAFAEQFRGWGRGLRRGVAAWYERDDTDALAYQLVKYRQRDGWTHRDLLRLAHPGAPTATHRALYDFACGRAADGLPAAAVAFLEAQKATDPERVVSLLELYGNMLPREAIPPEHLTRDVWAALVDAEMPMTGLIRNLATMTRCGLLTPTAEHTATVAGQITDGDRLRKARVHPVQVLAALLTYAAGRSVRGDSVWAPLPRVVDALDAAFYASFGNVEATGKRWLLALDVSGSMDMGTIAGVPGLTPRVASSAMAMVTAATGDPYEVVAFTSGTNQAGLRGSGLSVLPFSARQRLDDICAATNRLPFGGTDCALPMLYATQTSREFDAFAVYTDSETWHGQVHPSQALVQYRQQSGIDAKLIVAGMVSNSFTIADPDDAGMLDVVGFDTAAPQVIADFGAGL